MNDDLIKQFGYANLDTRLKRISDKMTHSLRFMYKKLEIDVEPSWYLVIFIVKNHPNCSVMDIAERLKFTHQSVIAMTNKMIANGYLRSAKDLSDKRKTAFNLTKKAKNNIPFFTKIWEIGKEVTYDLLNQDTIIMKHLDVLESNLEENSFGDRIIDKMKV